jgi:hypothetical protein
MADSSDEIFDSEWIMRRVPANLDSHLYDPVEGLMPDAFKPHRTRDADGLSVSRVRSDTHSEFLTPEIVAQAGQSKTGYYFAIVSVRALREAGMKIVADPTSEDPGHALITSLRSNNRKSVEADRWMQILARQLTTRVEGPFLKTVET